MHSLVGTQRQIAVFLWNVLDVYRDGCHWLGPMIHPEPGGDRARSGACIATAPHGSIRGSPSQPDPILSSNYVDTAFGVHILLPIGWSEVKAPDPYTSYSAFFANENVVSPLKLNDKGVWLSILYGALCVRLQIGGLLSRRSVS